MPRLPYNDPFSVRLRSRREQLGLSQRDLAQRMDPTFMNVDRRIKIKCPLKRSVAAISRYERGLRMPKVDRLRQLAIALKCSIDWLVGLESYK